MTADDRDSVQSVIDALGLHGALKYAAHRLTEERTPRIRQMMIWIIRETAMRLTLDVRRAKRLAACHASGLRQKVLR